MGDFNAGGSYVGASHWPGIPLRRDASRFSWLIPDHLDTTVAGGTNAAYDRVVAADGASAAVEPGSGAVFRFDSEFGLSSDLALRVSDHFPVEVTLRPRVHPSVGENVRVWEGFSLQEKR